MKRIFTFLLLLLAGTQMRAQQIDSIVVVPANPTPSDFVNVYIYLQLPNSSCAGTANYSVNGSLISGSSVHCQGMLNTICYDIDTFAVGMLAPGTYTVNYTLSSGFGIPNCSPGIVPDDNASTSFSVLITGMNPAPVQPAFGLAPNPSDGGFSISGVKPGDQTMLQVFTADGRLARSYAVSSTQQFFETGLQPGIYFVRLQDAEQTSAMQKIIISH